MKRLFALLMLFSLVLIFSPPEKVVKANVSDDICYSMDLEDNIISDYTITTNKTTPINYVEVGISPGLNPEVFITSCEIETRTLESDKIISQGMTSLSYDLYGYVRANKSNSPSLKTTFSSKYILDQERLEISPGDYKTKVV